MYISTRGTSLSLSESCPQLGASFSTNGYVYVNTVNTYYVDSTSHRTLAETVVTSVSSILHGIVHTGRCGNGVCVLFTISKAFLSIILRHRYVEETSQSNTRILKDIITHHVC
jgi:hypothetical protein